MRIGIDCLRVNPVYFGGLNTYVFGLLDGFAAIGKGNDFKLYVTEDNKHLFKRYQGLFDIAIAGNRKFKLRRSICRATLLSCNRRLHESASGLLMRPVREKMDSESDVIYTPTVSLLCFDNRKPTVLSMHDIQHVHYPEFFSWPRRLSRRITYGLSATRANYFQASSSFIKYDMLAHFPEISPDRIEVIPEGVNLKDFVAPRDRALLTTRYQLDKRFLFFPAQLWPHKNHLHVLKALKQIEERNNMKIPLIMTGAKYSAAKDVLTFLSDHSMSYARHLGKVPFDDLVGLYQSATYVISPGLYESNSLPILEAAAAGTAIIASAIPPNEELASSFRLNLFDPIDQAELSNVILRCWHDEKTRLSQVAHNSVAISRFSWENTAVKYLELFGKITHGVASA